MVNALGAIFLCGIVLIRATEANKGYGLKDLQRLKPLGSLAFEFLNYFQNASVSDLSISDREGDPTEEDMICLMELTNFAVAALYGEYWALKMFDSWGKYPSGMLTGNFYDLGNYDECLAVSRKISQPDTTIRGKYCFLTVTPSEILGNGNSIPEAWKIRIATCLPASCRASHMNKFLQRMLNLDVSTPGIGITESSCQTSDREPWDGLTVFTVAFLSVMGSIVVLFTLIDYLLCRNQDELPRLVKVFSARVHSRALFRVEDTKSNPNVIDCLHGIRCLSLFWVIYCHEYVMYFSSANINFIDMITWAELPYSSFVIHGFFSVDSFFFLSGMLVSLLALRYMDKTKGKLNVLLMYLHRLIRIFPIMAMAIPIYMKMMPLLADGPLFKDGFSGLEECKVTWYWSLLFMQNYVSNRCLGHTWYLAVDMQLFIISPILLIALYKWGKKAAAGIVILVLLISGCLFTTMMINNYSMMLKNITVPSMDNMYYATHTHATPWLIGFLFGYFLHLNRGRKFQLNWLVVGLGWLFSLALIFTSIFALYPAAKWTAPDLSTLADSFYTTLSRIAWPLALGWVVFACMQGYGGMANSFLSSPLWQPLSRLSYSIYMWHKFIMEINIRSVRTNTYFSDYEVMLKFWADLGFTLLMSYLLHLLIEAPFSGLGNFLTPPRKSSPVNKLDQLVTAEPGKVEEPQESTSTTSAD
ncbi:hypothetical protein KR009_002919 [Drosophila setifemur]|nr:hypothetical protein KR009_002919 [Drosophila setifemur]